MAFDRCSRIANGHKINVKYKFYLPYKTALLHRDSF